MDSAACSDLVTVFVCGSPSFISLHVPASFSENCRLCIESYALNVCKGRVHNCAAEHFLCLMCVQSRIMFVTYSMPWLCRRVQVWTDEAEANICPADQLRVGQW